MSAPSPATANPPRLIFSALIIAIALIASLLFAQKFENAPAFSIDPTLCGNPAPLELTKPAQQDHADHGEKKDEKVYFVGGLWSPKHGLGATLDAAMTAAAKERPIVCLSAFAAGESVVIIDRSPIRFSPVQADAKPDLVLSVDYTGGVSSMEYSGAAALQKYITDEKDKYNQILIVEPLPGPVRDPDEDWTYLNFDGDETIEFFTPKRKASPEEVAMALINELGGSASASSDVATLVSQLGTADLSRTAVAWVGLSQLSPYEVVPALDRWVASAEVGPDREARVFESLMVRRLMGIHADDLISVAATSENTSLRALAARTISDLASITADPIGKLTQLAEDDDMAVRYEALVATRAMPGRRAAGVAELVEPYEMTESMRSLYQGTLAELLAYGEPIVADSKANRLRRMPINELLGQARSALVCAILLERTDLPDEKIDEVLGQLAAANGRGPLVALLNLLEAMNPRTLATREALLKKLVSWKANELSAQEPRLKEMALGNGTINLRRSAVAAITMSSEPKAVLAELDNSPIAYEGLAWVTDNSVRKKWAEPIMEQAKKATPLETTIAAIDAVRLLPADSLTADNGTMLLGLAKDADDIGLRFAAIRAVNALPDRVKPPGTDALKLTSHEITAQTGMKYDKQSLTVTAGRPVELTLINPDTMEHNLVITLPGRAQEIGLAMSADPAAAAAIGYVPKDSDAVLQYTRMLKPGESETLRFIAPTKPGSYEYVCTYPGHSASMNGLLEVVAP